VTVLLDHHGLISLGQGHYSDPICVLKDIVRCDILPAGEATDVGPQGEPAIFEDVGRIDHVPMEMMHVVCLNAAEELNAGSSPWSCALFALPL
jgi:hypothetical protein